MTKHHLFADHRTTVCSHVGTDFKVSILITQGFSLLSLASMTDVFSAVESSWGHGRVKVRLLSVDGGPVRAASGSVILPDEAISTKGNPKVALSGSDAFVVCAGPELSTTENRTTIDVVRKCRLAAIPVCVMGAAVRAVAQSGQMTHATDHWTRIPANKETMPHVKFNNAIFVEDGNIVSCSGELGAMDFALNWVTSRTSARVAAQIRNHLLVSSSRSPDRVQTCTVADT